jgi:DNA modification methylase
MVERKLTKEDIDRVRDIEGFPIAKDEDIIALSRPPYYTACPNPFIEDFIRKHGTAYDEATDDYHCEPFAADVSEGKNDPIYMAHSYHTKVPYKAIMRYILHYTKPGDIVFDGFCGTGMTGVAAQMCGCADAETKMQFNSEMKGIEWGTRKAILNDLSPAATFIAHNYNVPVDVDVFQREAERILKECEKECGWMYQTQPTDNNGKPIAGITDKTNMGRINYTVWSDVLICPNCSHELIYWDVAIGSDRSGVKNQFLCSGCGSLLKKTDCTHAIETHADQNTGKTYTVYKQIPVLINYFYGGRRYEKLVDDEDRRIIEKINDMNIPYQYPDQNLPIGEKFKEPINAGITRTSLFYTRRNLYVIACIMDKAKQSSVSNQAMFLLTSVLIKTASKLHNIGLKNGTINLAGAMPNALFIPSALAERNIFELLRGKLKDILPVFTYQKGDTSLVSCSSTCSLSLIPDNSIDYIFTDPPFGSNLNYSELSFIWEAWLRVITNNKEEAIINRSQAKGLPEYQQLMERCFLQYFRVLKPMRWITIEFHNSKNIVWNAIQEALLRSGFLVADVRTINKEQGSYNQMTSSGAVKQDLVISAYKPKESFVREFERRAGDPEMAWEFVRQHLQNVPVAPDSTGKIEVVFERQDYLLFDRMVAFHIMRGIPVPIDAHTFYAGLRERFIQRDGMFFLPDQVNEYDERRQKMELQDQQLSLFITDEKSAIIWLNAQLGQVRQTYSEIQPKFLQDWHRNKFEQMPELLDMLKENFLQDEDGKWYVPNLSDKADLEKLRRKRLLKDFYEIYVKGTGRIRNARTEAIRVGFDECWQERNYSLIVKVGDRLPETVLQEDPALLMYYDNAANRM